MSASTRGRTILAALMDAESFESLTPRQVPPARQRSLEAAYEGQVAGAQDRTGSDDSVIAGTGTICGHDSVVVVCEFDFLAGTLSVAAGEAFATAVREALARRHPLVAVANSGGARMQEGSSGFAQMLKCVAALEELDAARLPFLVYLAHPSTGGVLASWASLGHVTFAEPGATIAFTGPRVAEATEEAHATEEDVRAERRLAEGHVDALVPLEQLASAVGQVLAAVAIPRPRDHRAAAPGNLAAGTQPVGALAPPTGWAAVLAARAIERPRPLDLLEACTHHRTRLRGDRAGCDDPAVHVSLCRLGDRPLMVIAHATTADEPARPTPAGLRLGIRAMSIAESLGIGVLTLIDTPGASIGPDAEREGVAGAIARSLRSMLGLRVPTVAVLVGEGSGGAAMALLGADLVIAATTAWLGPIAPEAASVILHRSPECAPAVADMQRVGPGELQALGIVDQVVELRGEGGLHHLDGSLGAAFAALESQPRVEREATRRARYDRLGLATP